MTITPVKSQVIKVKSNTGHVLFGSLEDRQDMLQALLKLEYCQSEDLVPEYTAGEAYAYLFQDEPERSKQDLEIEAQAYLDLQDIQRQSV